MDFIDIMCPLYHSHLGVVLMLLLIAHYPAHGHEGASHVLHKRLIMHLAGDHDLGRIIAKKSLVSSSNISGSLGFRSLRRLPTTGLYSFKLTIRKRNALQKMHTQKGLDYLEKSHNLSREDSESNSYLRSSLNSRWQDLDKMLYCTKLYKCTNRYKKFFNLGDVKVTANLIQSIAITFNQITSIANKLNKLGIMKYT